jgi:RHS repeat-associated protein
VASIRPHAVSSVAGTVNATYIYDANGNLGSGADRTLTYKSFNLPDTITRGTDSFQYVYGPKHERVKLIVQRTSGVYTTIYLHPNGGAELLFEKETTPDGTEYRHYVNAGTYVVGAYLTKSSGSPEMRYFHYDSLDSLSAITNNSGAVVERLAYEPFGKRRYPNGTADPTNLLFGVTTDRGFTGHEHLDELGLIHMNGRVYDPLLGRFMTPDPFIQFSTYLQSFNRYSYVLNNPLRAIDPEGFTLPIIQHDGGGLGDGGLGDGGLGDGWPGDPSCIDGYSPDGTPQIVITGTGLGDTGGLGEGPTVPGGDVLGPDFSGGWGLDSTFPIPRNPRELGDLGQLAQAPPFPARWGVRGLILNSGQPNPKTPGGKSKTETGSSDLDDALNVNAAAGGAAPPPEGGDNNDNNKGSNKDEQPASEKTARDIAKRIERDLGKDARREFHDVKEGGASDRTLGQLKQDARDLYIQAGKDIPSWLK